MPMQFVWSPSNPQQSVVVLELGQLYTGLLRNKLQPVHSNRIVACVAWSPDGQMLALAVEQQVIVWDLQQHAEGFQTSIQIQDEDLGEYLVDSVLWTSPTSILTCLGPAEDSGLALAAMLTWDVWEAADPSSHPEGLKVQVAARWTVSEAPAFNKESCMTGVLVPE
ncbi:MAG: hypothetical protein FRX49_03217 [Trebouxia sp. A1-2]|nr:MAG: hypothetical protein FRX49_03217 [Trebouxia sp. A1-2]